MCYFDKYLELIFRKDLSLNEESDEQSKFAKKAYNMIVDYADASISVATEVTDVELEEELEKLQINQDLLEKLLKNLNEELP